MNKILSQEEIDALLSGIGNPLWLTEYPEDGLYWLLGTARIPNSLLVFDKPVLVRVEGNTVSLLSGEWTLSRADVCGLWQPVLPPYYNL
jgi:hypothetical protein